MINYYDVVIAGAGPAGSAAAEKLVKAGLSAAIIDKQEFPRFKVCGGRIVPRAKKLLPQMVGESIEKTFHEVHVNFLDTGHSFVVRKKIPVMYTSMRENLDFLLLKSAENAGANLFEKCELRDLTHKPGYIVVITNKDTFSARFLIGADGALSTVAKKGGWRETRTLIPALECEIKTGPETCKVRFDFGIVPYGYGWVFPKLHGLSAGVLSKKPDGVNLNIEFKKYSERIRLPLNNMVRYRHLIPIQPRRDCFARNRIILTGDAAGLADPVTFEGISNALLSGRLAAAAIVKGNFKIEKVCRIYHRYLKKNILLELAIGRFLSKFLYGTPSFRRFLFKHHGQKLCHAVSNIALGQETYLKSIINPLNYLRLFLY